ncbi:multidrug efflux pump subunit AcrB [Wenyingzhuangia heitensis]|uniref:Multidrug efflux pump subunit AcrB n=1 Tax=Wenyingzhuangia heitensis TaxID=1487859 RepID=A0ABX0U6E1_9FLAO|nr:efflux RND transporter permease subunit [Wenyingzhuangia heitensis]NIJ44422.1 multidrug efflux pump subunit AcrB [Wenyingzhuangia heitensis]
MNTNKTIKEFVLSSWAINNKTTMYVLIALMFILGLSAYNNLPRENFPEIKETKIYVNAIYPGSTAEDIERLIIDPLEDELEGISNVTEITSTSQEDVGIIIIEFNEKVTVEQAKTKVKDEVDGVVAGEDWPTFNGAKVDPAVFDLNIAEETPIMNINISGDYPVEKLKEYAELIQDKVEEVQEIKAADIRGAQEKEVEVAVDIYKMMAAQISFDDVLNAIRQENVTTSAGNLISSGQRRTIRVLGEIENPEDLKDFVIKTQDGIVHLNDIATVKFQEEEKTTYAREWGHNVVMLDVKKRSGTNMVAATEQVKEALALVQEKRLPSDLTITISNDQSSKTLNQVDELVNNIIFGILLVVIVLMFFLGFRNALFVGFAIPMSMFMSFMLIEAFGYTMNTMILFGMIMGLGMLVDNGIVVVENVFRLMEDEGMTRIEAAKKGIGEIAFPIIISTLTTVAAFVPLGLWPGVMGQFMKYFPITLSIVLGSSLFVALFFNSVLVSQFMSIDQRILSTKQLIRLTLILGVLGIPILLFGGAYKGLGSVMLVTIALFWAYKYFIKGIAIWFQEKALTWFENTYEKFLRFALTGWKPYVFLIGTFVLLIASFIVFGASVGSGRTKVEFFPDNKPNQILVYLEYPEGTDIEKTNAITKEIEKDVFKVLNDELYQDGDYNFMVESAVSQVGMGAGNPQTDSGTTEMPHRGKITASLREFKFRRGLDSEELRIKVQLALKNKYPGLSISVEKESVGPPAGYPINIEIQGEDYQELISVANKMQRFIAEKNVPGVDELKVDVNKQKPAIEVEVDRKKAGALGVPVALVANQLRRSIFGEKAGVYKENGEDYDIYVRFNEKDKTNTSAIFNQYITFRSQIDGQIKEVPVSVVTTRKNTSSFSAIKHKNGKRTVVVYSALAPGYTDAQAVVNQIVAEMADFDAPDSVTFDFTGQIEEQNKQMSFLMGALLTGLGLIAFILVFQFSSVTKPAIIMFAILLSFTGVFFGIIGANMSFVIMMTMMGIISLAGIVVNNGVVLLDYTQLLFDRKAEELNLPEDHVISVQDAFDAIVQGGKARLRPVILTAITTVIGLIPLAQGLNIDFFGLFNEGNAHIYVGGDNVIFWGPLAWTVIFGLTFATFLTLVIVPVMFYLLHKVKVRIKNK